MDEFIEWLDEAIKKSEEACDKADVHSSDYSVLLERNRTLIVTRQKLIELIEKNAKDV